MEKIGLLLFLAVLVKEDSTLTDSSLGIITAINDSSKHQYIDLREGDNWCWMHNKWEFVRIVNSGYRRKEDIDSLETVSLNN
tara:strand:- start:100 stop:345 length:246 start_codon:yes stop_codon:yes gene_type:complete